MSDIQVAHLVGAVMLGIATWLGLHPGKDESTIILTAFGVAGGIFFLSVVHP